MSGGQSIFEKRLSMAVSHLQKKGAILLTIQSAPKAPKSWQLQTILVFLSPLLYKALHPMKYSWLKLPAKVA
jgi:hypothetical protein